jgi:hypothetical protein
MSVDKAYIKYFKSNIFLSIRIKVTRMCSRVNIRVTCIITNGTNRIDQK